MTEERFLSLSFLKTRLNKDLLQQVTLETGVCMECGGELYKAGDGEVACQNCGLVWNGQLVERDRIPVSEPAVENGHAESHWNPECSLAFGKSLGNTLPLRGLYKVLAKAPAGTKDLGLRARQISFMLCYEEPPQLRKALEYASKRIREMKADMIYPFVNDVGSLLRKVVAYLIISKTKFYIKDLVNAVLYYTIVRKYGIWLPHNVENEVFTAWYGKTELKFKRKTLDILVWLVENPSV